MSTENESLEPLTVASKAWNQRDLLANIVSRHFVIKEELGGLWPTWIVYPIVEEEKENDVHDSLEELNQHLEKLDWMAELGIDDPWIIKIKPRPIRQFSLTVGAKIFFWLSSLVSTLLVGIVWFEPLNDDSMWYDAEILLPVLLYYSLPFIFTIWVASSLQRQVAKRFSMRVGGIVPIMLPFPYIPWPFGVVSIPSAPRMDDVKWNDRHRLGMISLVAPATLLIFGLIFVTIGLLLTPQYLEIYSMPNRLGFSLLPQAIGTLTLGEDGYLLASTWAHPLAFAGQGLMLIGWVSLLPFPGLPGNRILVAEMGLQGVRSTGSQIALFLAICVTGLMFGAFTGHQFWTFLTILGGLGILLNGADTSTPTILDDVKTFSESSSISISHVIFLTLLLALPAEFPTEEVTTWDDELVWDFPEISEVEINATTNLSISINSASMITRSWSINSLGNHTGWSLSWNCNGEIIEFSEVCNGEIKPLENAKIDIIVQSPQSAINSTGITVELWIEDEAIGFKQNLQIVPDVPVISKSQYWTWDGNHVSPKICSTLSIKSEAPIGNLTLSDSNGDNISLWSFENSSRIVVNPNDTTGEFEVCAIGVSGAIHILENSDQLDGKVVPKLQWIGDDGQMWSAILSLQSSSPNLLSNGNAIAVGSEHELFSSGQHLLHGNESTTCDLNAAPRLPAGNNTTWSWDLNLREEGLLPELEEGPINLTIPDSGWLHVCGNNSIIPVQSWKIQVTSNQELSLTTWGGKYLDSWFKPSVASNSSENGTITTNLNLPVDDSMIRLHGDGTVNPTINGTQATVSISFVGSEDRVSVFWIEVQQDGKVLLNIASWSLGGSE